VINHGFIVNCCYATIKTFMHARAREKVQFIGATAEASKILLQQIPPDQLPKKYGGLNIDLDEIGPQTFPYS
jgi:hypothetical protein